MRDIEQKAGKYGDPLSPQFLNQQLQLAHRLLAQTRTSENKCYSIHTPEVECIAKGKAHKRYEFGCKASFVTSSQNNWVVRAQALHGNPYDRHILWGALLLHFLKNGLRLFFRKCSNGSFSKEFPTRPKRTFKFLTWESQDQRTERQLVPLISTEVKPFVCTRPPSVAHSGHNNQIANR